MRGVMHLTKARQSLDCGLATASVGVGALGNVLVSADEFVAAVEAELRDHFRWTSVEGLVELEARQVAWSAFRRLAQRT